MRPGHAEIPVINDGRPLPDPRSAQDGLVAVGGAMTVSRLVEAYRAEIFPWTSDPVTWWSPDRRAVLDLDQIHVPHRLQQQIRKHPYRVTFDTAFGAVMIACATAPREDDTSWSTEEFMDAYGALHK